MIRFAWMVSLALVACGGDDALDSGDCPGTPSDVTVEPVAPFATGLVLLEFKTSPVPQGVELQSYSPSRHLWQMAYGEWGQRDDGTYVVQVRPRVSTTDSASEYKLRVRTTLQGCPPSGWSEAAPIALEEPIVGTTWSVELGPTSFAAPISVNVNAGTGTSVGPYKIAASPPTRHTIKFDANGKVTETLEMDIQSGHAGDLYNGCHFKIAMDGTWVLTDEYDRLAIFGRHITSLAGSTCSNPPVADLTITSPVPLTDYQLYPGNIDYSRLLEMPAGVPAWSNVQLLQASFSTILAGISDQTGPETSTISGYIDLYNSAYKQQP